MAGNLAPICLFTYNRLAETIQTVSALQKNYLAKESDIIIFSDGPKDKESESKVQAVRNYLKTIEGFKTVNIIVSKENKGLANSIIEGVTTVINDRDKVIVLEDDLVTSSNFLNFMNQALNFYSKEPDIFSISGFSPNLPSLQNKSFDIYLGYRASSWGWATWKKNWETIDWEINDYNKFSANFLQQLRFTRGGSDMPGMLRRQMKGEIDSWAIRWCFNQFRKDQYTIFPSKSKVLNIGFNQNATHTKGTKRFRTTIDSGDKQEFDLPVSPLINKKIAAEFRRDYSIYSRILDKIKNALSY